MKAKDARSLEIAFWQRQAAKPQKSRGDRDRARMMVRTLTAEIPQRKGARIG